MKETLQYVFWFLTVGGTLYAVEGKVRPSIANSAAIVCSILLTYYFPLHAAISYAIIFLFIGVAILIPLRKE